MAQSPSPAGCGTFPPANSGFHPKVIVVIVLTMAALPIIATVAGVQPAYVVLFVTTVATSVLQLMRVVYRRPAA